MPISTYDLIIGYPIILQYDILDRLRSSLIINVVNNNANNLIQHENAPAHSLSGALLSNNIDNTKITHMSELLEGIADDGDDVTDLFISEPPWESRSQ